MDNGQLTIDNDSCNSLSIIHFQLSIAAVVLVCVLVISGCGDSPKPVSAVPAAKTQERVNKLLGDKIVGVLQGADRVETFRIERINPEPGYKILATGAVWRDEKARQVATLFLEEKNYVWDSRKACKPQPGVLLRIWRTNESVDVLLCFECMILQAGKAGEWKEGDFDPMNSQLVKLAKEALPDDKVIQGLKDDLNKGSADSGTVETRLEPTNILGDVAIFQNADRVEVYRLENFKIISDGASLTGQKAKSAAALFIDPNNYLNGLIHKLCLPHYGVLFRIRQGKSVIEIAVCFECKMLRNAPRKDSNIIGGEGYNFDPMYPQLVKLAKEALPNDKVIQALHDD